MCKRCEGICHGERRYRREGRYSCSRMHVIRLAHSWASDESVPGAEDFAVWKPARRIPNELTRNPTIERNLYLKVGAAVRTGLPQRKRTMAYRSPLSMETFSSFPQT